jgi:probable F420-dependent oxidoreductase
MVTMKIGVFATFMSPIATPEMITNFGRRAEKIGLDSIWLGEHVVLFDEMEFPYPGSRDGKIPVPAGGGLLDTVATFGFLAGATSTIRLGSGICLVPQRNPIYTAKEFATLDWLSGGRIDFGLGVGWCKEEVIACGYSFEDRGARCDEFIALIQKLWTDPIVSFKGKHFELAECRMDPKPVQTPSIPVFVGGHGPPSLRRAARFGSGWYGFGVTPEHVKPTLAKLDAALAAEGRSREGFEIVITPPYNVTVEMLSAFQNLGVDRVLPMLGSQHPDAITERLQELEVLVRAAA